MVALFLRFQGEQTLNTTGQHNTRLLEGANMPVVSFLSSEGRSALELLMEWWSCILTDCQSHEML